MNKTPLITIELTLTGLQAAQLSHALEVGGQDTDTKIALKLGDLLDKARRKLDANPTLMLVKEQARLDGTVRGRPSRRQNPLGK